MNDVAAANVAPPRDVHLDVMEQVDATGIDLHRMTKLADSGAHALCKMPHCDCVITNSALGKWLAWLEIASDDDLAIRWFVAMLPSMFVFPSA